MKQAYQLLICMINTLTNGKRAEVPHNEHYHPPEYHDDDFEVLLKTESNFHCKK